MAYFNHFPVIGYDVRGEKNNINIQFITNVLVRIRKKLEVTNNYFFEQYFVIEGDRPDTLAHQIYGDSDLHWIILYANYMTNPFYDWPLSNTDLQKYVAKKYDNNIYGVNHWEDIDGYEVDETASGATVVTHYLHEEKLNDAKRSINIIKLEFVDQIIKEFKQLVD
tara:strand:- start:1539 stop:2036 length:498 start_codon:yes stop_codon:yes gene_type:complete